MKTTFYPSKFCSTNHWLKAKPTPELSDRPAIFSARLPKTTHELQCFDTFVIGSLSARKFRRQQSWSMASWIQVKQSSTKIIKQHSDRCFINILFQHFKIPHILTHSIKCTSETKAKLNSGSLQFIYTCKTIYMDVKYFMWSLFAKDIEDCFGYGKLNAFLNFWSSCLSFKY